MQISLRKSNKWTRNNPSPNPLWGQRWWGETSLPPSFPYIHLHNCLTIYPPIYLSILPPRTYLLTLPIIHAFIYLCILPPPLTHPPPYNSLTHPSTHLLTYLSIFLAPTDHLSSHLPSTNLYPSSISIHPPTHLSTYLPPYISIYLSLSSIYLKTSRREQEGREGIWVESMAYMYESGGMKTTI